MDPSRASRGERLHLSRWAKWGISGFVFLGLGLLVRWAAVDYAVGASVRTVRVVERSFFERAQRKAPPTDELFPLWSWEQEEGTALEEPDSQRDDVSPAGEIASAPIKESPRAPRAAGPSPHPENARASVERVLTWAAANLVPRGRTVAASGGAPAGIELYGVAPLGIGLRDGDRLVSVDGRPVTERGHVVGAVLAARSQKAEAMTAGLVRQTADGFIPFSVVVEQPYPEHVDAFSAEHERQEAQGEQLEEPTGNEKEPVP